MCSLWGSGEIKLSPSLAPTREILTYPTAFTVRIFTCDTMSLFRNKPASPEREDALPGRNEPDRHFVLGTPIRPPFPNGYERAVFGMGCFWGAEKLFWEYGRQPDEGLSNPKGAERMFWQAPGVWTTAAGYAGGTVPEPSYKEVCSGRTGHVEVVLAVFDPEKTSYEELLRIFWEGHDPTQGMRQGNDVGTQYRSLIHVHSPEQCTAAEASRAMYEGELAARGYGAITTEIADATPFYYAEDYHQQYLAKNPSGYCGLGGTGVACPVGLVTSN
jgi:peptide-methionine (S)-S-oxide reductase